MKLFLEPHPVNDNYFMNGFSIEDLEQIHYKHLYSRQMFTANYFPFDIVYNIPDEPYLYSIRSDMLITYTGNTSLSNLLKNFSFTIPDNVIADVKRNKCKILIDNSIETYDVIITEHDSTINQIILRTIKRYNLDKKHVILITGNYRSITSEHYLVAIKNWADTLIIPCDSTFFENQKHMILSKTVRPKKILTFMRKERLFRFHLANFIYSNKLREYNIVTFGKTASQYYWDKNSAHFSKDFLDSLPWEYDVDTRPTNPGLDHLLARSEKEITAFTETYINCVAERSMKYLDYELDISEKIFKPIAFLQPFFVFGQPGTLDYMKRLGYRTFDRWWDESYDTATSESIRFRMLTRLYKKLSLASDKELADIMYEAWPILEHNYYTYVDYVSSGKTNQDLLKTIQLSFDK